MTTSRGIHRGAGVARATIATVFALALVAWMALPAIADGHDADAGPYVGQIVEVDEDEQWFEADALTFDPEAFEEAFDEWLERFEDGEEPTEEDFEEFFDEFFGELEPESLRFHVTHDDDLNVNFDQVDKETFLCVAALNVDDNVFLGDYDPEGESELYLLVEDDECPDEVEEEEHREPITRPERVDTGAGGSDAGGLGVLALMLGLGTAAGVTFLRKGHATS